MTEVRVGLGSLWIVEALEELSEGVGERVLVTNAEAGDPPVTGVRMIAVGRVDAGPTATVARNGVVEVVETIEIMLIPLE